LVQTSAQNIAWAASVKSSRREHEWVPSAGVELTLPRDSTRSRAQMRAPILGLGDEGGDRPPDRFRVVFLQEVHAGAKPDQPAILKPAGELFGKGGRHERARFGGEHELWIGGAG
jgi:hypothetical protein